jgi:phenylpropionate dioxygenase-like ring-hydroxylating dioxygenase large terminal subunit
MGEWQLDRLDLFRASSIETTANWKLTVDTYLETYHFAILHPRTVAKTHYSDHTPFDAYGPHGLMGFTGKSIGQLADVPEEAWEPLKHLQFIYFLFPNLVFTVMRDHVEYFQILPGSSVARATTNHVYFTIPGSPYSSEEVADDRFGRTHGILVEEDCPTAETMQHNIETRPVTAFVFGRNEPALQHFHRRIDEHLAEA